MSMLIYFALLLTIIAYQSIKDRKTYKLNLLAKARVNAQQELEADLKKELDQKKAFQKALSGHYAITHRESLSPTLNQGAKRMKKPKSVGQS